MADLCGTAMEAEASVEAAEEAPLEQETTEPSTPDRQTAPQDESTPTTVQDAASQADCVEDPECAAQDEYTAGLEAKMHEYAAQVRKIEGDNAALRSRLTSVDSQCSEFAKKLEASEDDRRIDNERTDSLIRGLTNKHCALDRQKATAETANGKLLKENKRFACPHALSAHNPC